MNGMAVMTIQAPWMNFVWTTTASTTAVVAAPTPLMAILRRHPLPVSSFR
jgi:hypothetical protein